MPNKRVSGRELLIMISDYMFKNRDRIREIGVCPSNEYSYKESKEDFYCHKEERWLLAAFNTKTIMDMNFEIISETEEIDINSIEEYEEYFIEHSSADESVKNLARKCNDLIKAVKQINRKLEY